jgi:hypothetical protein
MLKKAVSKAAASKEARRSLQNFEDSYELRTKPGERRVPGQGGCLGRLREGG